MAEKMTFYVVSKPVNSDWISAYCKNASISLDTFDSFQLFYYSRIMDIKNSLKIFDTLSQETRLQVFRLLVQAGPEGLSAGAIGDDLGILHNTLSFHLSHLSNAGIVSSYRQGRYVFYSANFDLMRDFITFMVQDCCSKQQVQIQQPGTNECLVIEVTDCCKSKKE